MHDTSPRSHDTPPCAELHLHLEGSLEPEMVFSLAGRNGLALPYADVEDLRGRLAFTDLQSFLDLYYANMAVLRTEEDFADLTTAYLRRAAAGNIRHAEIMFDPQAHLVRGVPLEVVVGGIGAALADSERYGVSTHLIAAFLRDRPAAEAMEVLDALVGSGAPIRGIGLDSAEVGNPPSLFVDVFDRARAEGLHVVAHAGEEGPPEYVREALDLLRVERVDHGIRAMEDPELVARLRDERVPLTVCPLSNVRLRAVDTMADHPLPAMLAAGLHVLVNSDDPAYFGGYVDDNVRALVAATGLGPDEVATLARNSFTASWLEPSRRDELLAEVDAWRATQPG